MKRSTILTAGAMLLCVGMGAVAQTTPSQTTTTVRPAYDPFAMQRAALTPGTPENDAFNRRQAIVTRLRDRARPPFHPGNRSPHQPGNPYHDRNGDGIEDHGGHGPDSDPN